MKSVLMVVNDHESFVPTQTSYMLCDALTEMGHSVSVQSVDEVLATTLALEQYDLILSRTNPGRDNRPEQKRVLAKLASSGTRVINDPKAIQKFLSKESLLSLPPDLLPSTCAPTNKGEVQAFFDRHGPLIAKPLVGTRGMGITFIQTQTELDAWKYPSDCLLQEFIPGATGDARVWLVHGELIEIDGCIAGVLRVPKQGSMLGNLHAGATPAPIVWDERLHEAVSKVGAFVRQENLALVGADFLGHKLIELNVASPGGLYWAENYYQKPFAKASVERLLNG